MEEKKQPETPVEIPPSERKPEIVPPEEPKAPISIPEKPISIPDESPAHIPQEAPPSAPPQEVPPSQPPRMLFFQQAWTSANLVHFL